MLDEADEMTDDALVSGAEAPDRIPPVRRGTRDERRDATLRALGSGQDAWCAYCGRRLPPLPPKGGRPTPYCPADPDRYGQWGARTISCAMLDEHREIWVSVYGPDQPMTQVDVQTLDSRVGVLLAALDPVRTEVGALQSRISDATAAALTAKDAAERARDDALEQVRVAQARCDEAVAEAQRARDQADQDRAERRAAQTVAAESVQSRDTALAARHTAEQDRDTAEADRQRALDQVTAAHDRITELQTTLAGERASALDRLDRLRRDEDEAHQRLRAALVEDYEHRLRSRADEFEEQTRAQRAAADQRLAELTSQLTQATHTYARTLGPLHEQIATLRGELADQTATATALRRQVEELHAAPTDPTVQPAEDPRPRRSAEDVS